MSRTVTRTELILRESGLWAILERTGNMVSVVETGHLDRALAEFDLESWRTSGRLSPIGQAWIQAADRLRRNVAQRKYIRGGQAISREMLLKILLEQGYCCAITGRPFEPIGEGPWQPSVDRIDNGRGYEPTNLRIVSYIVNIAMNVWGEGPLIELAEQIMSRETPG